MSENKKTEVATDKDKAVLEFEKFVNALDEKILEIEAHQIMLINMIKDPKLKKIMMLDFQKKHTVEK